MHTKGPWVIIPNYGGYQSEINGGGRAIATVWTKQKAPHVSNTLKEGAAIPWPEGEANAALIISAPDLLAEVARLTAENADLKAALDEMLNAADVMVKELLALRARVAELEAALGPLAAVDIAAVFATAGNAEQRLCDHSRLTVGHVLQARKALGEGGK